MTVTFDPLLSPWLIALIALVAVLLAALGLYRRQRGMVLRTIALALLVGALVNPVIMNEEREPLSTIVAIAADRSQSQDVGERKAQTDQAIAQLQSALGRFKNIEARVIDAGRDTGSETPSTMLYSNLASELEDVPPSRIGAVIAVTDGQVHDVPRDNRLPGIDAPVHALITGKDGEYDRRVEIVKAPRFGLINHEQELSSVVLDIGIISVWYFLVMPVSIWCKPL